MNRTGTFSSFAGSKKVFYMVNNSNTLIQITQNGMGSGNEDLGLKLIGNYFKLILQEQQLPQFMVFYNAGVKLLCEGSPVIESLREIEAMGVKLIACKTCLDFYNLIPKLQVGTIGSMIDIIDLQNSAQKIIQL